MANKKTALAHLIGQNLDRRSKQNRMLEEEVSSEIMQLLSEPDTMKQAARSDMLNLSW